MARFKKGESGNPSGRTPGKTNKVTQQARKMLEENAGAVLQATIDSALGGDSTAQRLVLGLALPRRIRPILELPPLNNTPNIQKALAVIAHAAASGVIEPEDAKAIAAIIEATGQHIDHNRYFDLINDCILKEIDALAPDVGMKLLKRVTELNELSPENWPTSANHLQLSGATKP
jgi:hypothetical protein